MDTTESRYAEIARKMLETGDWLMPQFDYGVPFWGKPPLSTWLSAASMAAFGVNEFAARLPSLALLAGCGALVYALAAQRGGRDQALWTLALFAATAHGVRRGRRRDDRSGAHARHDAVDGRILVSRSTARSVTVASRAARSSPGSAVGLLAKGPVAAVLVLVPIGAWTLWTRSVASAWQRASVGRRIAARGRARRRLVLGSGAGDARLSRVLFHRRALEALRRARMDRRSVRRRAYASARDDLALLDRRGAAVVGRRARRDRADAACGGATRCARLRPIPGASTSRCGQ